MTTATTTADYYEVFEAALSGLTARGEYRRHFGAPATSSPPGYCWFKTVTAPERHLDYLAWLDDAGTRLERQLLADMPRKRPNRLIDVGCGNGPLLRRVTREHPGVAVTGINSQPTQLRIAHQALQGTGAKLVEGDFLQHELGSGFDVALLLESAFHMPNKAQLCRRLAQVLAPDGEVWMIDIAIAERAAEAFQSLGSETLFNYVPRKEWQVRFAEHGFAELEFTDLSRGAADVLQISDIKLLERDYFTPRLTAAMSHGAAEPDAQIRTAVARMVQIATDYRRLSRLLRGGMLQYVLMRYKKTGAAASA